MTPDEAAERLRGLRAQLYTDHMQNPGHESDCERYDLDDHALRLAVMAFDGRLTPASSPHVAAGHNAHSRKQDEPSHEAADATIGGDRSGDERATVPDVGDLAATVAWTEARFTVRMQLPPGCFVPASTSPFDVLSYITLRDEPDPDAAA